MTKRKLEIQPAHQPSTRAYLTVSRNTHARLKREAVEKGRPIMELADILLNRALDDYELVNS